MASTVESARITPAHAVRLLVALEQAGPTTTSEKLERIKALAPRLSIIEFVVRLNQDTCARALVFIELVLETLAAQRTHSGFFGTFAAPPTKKETG